MSHRPTTSGRRACGAPFADPLTGTEQHCTREAHGARGVHRNGGNASTDNPRFRRTWPRPS